MALSRAWIISLSAFLLLSESLISERALGSSVATGIFNETAIPSPVAGAREITFGRGGWWFTEFAANKVGRLGPSGDVVEFAIWCFHRVSDSDSQQRADGSLCPLQRGVVHRVPRKQARENHAHP